MVADTVSRTTARAVGRAMDLRSTTSREDGWETRRPREDRASSVEAEGERTGNALSADQGSGVVEWYLARWTGAGTESVWLPRLLLEHLMRGDRTLYLSGPFRSLTSPDLAPVARAIVDAIWHGLGVVEATIVIATDVDGVDFDARALPFGCGSQKTDDAVLVQVRRPVELKAVLACLFGRGVDFEVRTSDFAFTEQDGDVLAFSAAHEVLERVFELVKGLAEREGWEFRSQFDA